MAVVMHAACRTCRLTSHISGFDPAGAASRKSKVVGVAALRAEHEEAAAADVAGRRMRDRQRKCGRHRRIDGVAAVADHLEADLRRDGALRDDHPALGAEGRRAGLERQGGDDEGEQDEEDARHGAIINGGSLASRLRLSCTPYGTRARRGAGLACRGAASPRP